MKDSVKIFIIISAIVSTGIAAALGGGYMAGQADGSCYRDLAAYNSWPELKPYIREIAADDRITVAECRNLETDYDFLYRRQQIKEALK